MARLCFILALLSPIVLPFAGLLVWYGPGQSVFTAHNAPALILMAISPLAFIASAIIGIKLLLDGQPKHTGWLAAGLVIDYCWFHVCIAAFIIQTIKG